MVNYEYPPLGGGTAVCNQALVAQFRRRPDLKVDVLTTSPDKYQVVNLPPNVRMIKLDIGKNNRNLHHQSYRNLLVFFIKSSVWIFKNRSAYDLIHAYSGLPGSASAWLSGLPYIVSLGGADEPGYEPRHNLFWLMFKPLFGRIYQQAQSIDVNSLFLKKLVLRSWLDLKIKIISNGVDTKKFYPAAKAVTQPIILSTSRFGARKGVKFLIQALADIPHAQLWLAGSGIEEPKLKSLAQKLRLSSRIKFLGLVPRRRLPSLYRQAKIFVLPSLSESRSNALLEALASGLPVVATNIGGNPELVNNNNGLLVNPSDSHNTAIAIRTTLTKKWRLPRISAKYSWENCARQYRKIYSAFSKARPSSTNL